jgi:hypothetical protein
MDRPDSEWNLTRDGNKSLKLTETERGPHAAGSDFFFNFFTNATMPVASILSPTHSVLRRPSDDEEVSCRRLNFHSLLSDYQATFAHDLRSPRSSAIYHDGFHQSGFSYIRLTAQSV